MSLSKLAYEIGSNIKQLRLAKGFGQKQVADALKISVAAFSKIENGLTDLNLSRLAQIAKYFQVSIADLLVKDTGNIPQNMVEEIDHVKQQLLDKDQEISKLQKKVIDLYDKLGL